MLRLLWGWIRPTTVYIYVYGWECAAVAMGVDQANYSIWVGMCCGCYGGGSGQLQYIFVYGWECAAVAMGVDQANYSLYLYMGGNVLRLLWGWIRPTTVYYVRECAAVHPHSNRSTVLSTHDRAPLILPVLRCTASMIIEHIVYVLDVLFAPFM